MADSLLRFGETREGEQVVEVHLKQKNVNQSGSQIGKDKYENYLVNGYIYSADECLICSFSWIDAFSQRCNPLHSTIHKYN